MGCHIDKHHGEIKKKMLELPKIKLSPLGSMHSLSI